MFHRPSQYSLTAGLLALVGCSYRPAPVVAVPPTPAPAVMALPAPPLGQAVATAQALPLLGSPVVSVTAPSAGFTSVVFAQLPGTLPPGPGVLGFVSPLGQYVAIGLDPAWSGITLDTTSAPYPVLRTDAEVFNELWRPAAGLTVVTLLHPAIDGTIRAYRNGLKLSPSIDYTASGATVTLARPTQAGDVFNFDYFYP